jgi:hypothetical protein
MTDAGDAMMELYRTLKHDNAHSPPLQFGSGVSVRFNSGLGRAARGESSRWVQKEVVNNTTS